MAKRWGTPPPSQYNKGASKKGTATYTTLIVACVVSLFIGLGGGLVLNRTGEQARVDPTATTTAGHRAAVVASLDGDMAAVVQLDAATVVGGPSTYDTVVFAKERRDLCVSGRSGMQGSDRYRYACGVAITWYLAAGNGSVRDIRAAALARFQGHRIGTRGPKWADAENRKPSRTPTGAVTVAAYRSPATLTALQHSAAGGVTDGSRAYYTTTDAADLPAAYAAHAGGRKVVAAITLTAQYAWTAS